MILPMNLVRVTCHYYKMQQELGCQFQCRAGSVCACGTAVYRYREDMCPTRDVIVDNTFSAEKENCSLKYWYMSKSGIILAVRGADSKE